MKLHLVDLNAQLVTEWQRAFAAFPEVEIVCADLIAVAHSCVVSPANSYGFMDGGIDREYFELFGQRVQNRVQDLIAQQPEGKLPVGASLVIRTYHEQVPFLILAPTMEFPGPCSHVNAYHAMVAVLRAANSISGLVQDVFCPGLCTGTGRVAESDAADEMAAAYGDWRRKGDRGTGDRVTGD